MSRFLRLRYGYSGINAGIHRGQKGYFNGRKIWSQSPCDSVARMDWRLFVHSPRETSFLAQSRKTQLKKKVLESLMCGKSGELCHPRGMNFIRFVGLPGEASTITGRYLSRPTASGPPTEIRFPRIASCLPATRSPTQELRPRGAAHGTRATQSGFHSTMRMRHARFLLVGLPCCPWCDSQNQQFL